MKVEQIVSDLARPNICEVQSRNSGRHSIRAIAISSTSRSQTVVQEQEVSSPLCIDCTACLAKRACKEQKNHDVWRRTISPEERCSANKELALVSLLWTFSTSRTECVRRIFRRSSESQHHVATRPFRLQRNLLHHRIGSSSQSVTRYSTQASFVLVERAKRLSLVPGLSPSAPIKGPKPLALARHAVHRPQECLFEFIHPTCCGSSHPPRHPRPSF